jgi:hypothetical protein
VYVVSFLSSFTHSDPDNQYPSQIYDIRGIFDGSIIKKGWNGYPTQIYTSVFPEPLGVTSDPPEKPGAETQTICNHKHSLVSLESKNLRKVALLLNAPPVTTVYDVEHLHRVHR